MTIYVGDLEANSLDPDQECGDQKAYRVSHLLLEDETKVIIDGD